MPAKYLVDCNDPELSHSQEAINQAKEGNYKFYSIEQAGFIIMQKDTIGTCDKNTQDLKEYLNGRVN